MMDIGPSGNDCLLTVGWQITVPRLPIVEVGVGCLVEDEDTETINGG